MSGFSYNLHIKYLENELFANLSDAFGELNNVTNSGSSIFNVGDNTDNP